MDVFFEKNQIQQTDLAFDGLRSTDLPFQNETRFIIIEDDFNFSGNGMTFIRQIAIILRGYVVYYRRFQI
jgi:hypothetical protein